MASIDQILRQRRRLPQQRRRTPTRAQEVARFQRAREAEVARRTTIPRFMPQSQRVKASQQRVKDPPRGVGVGVGGPIPFAQTRAGLTFAAREQRAADARAAARADTAARLQHKRDLQIQRDEQAFQARELDKRLAREAQIRAEERERARKANITQLRVERQGTFAALLKSGDQARAVIFALGLGPDNDIFDVRARALGTTVQELKGAQALRTTTQEALSRVLDRQVTIGREGVRGLGTAIGAARSFVQGGADVRQLLISSFGVGSLRAGERPGMSAARLAELTASVTPTGLL